MVRKTFDLSIARAIPEFKLKNEGSCLGVFWYLLNPLLLFTLLLLVFSDRLGKDIPQYPAYLLLGIIMFNFFRQATMDSTKVIYENRWIIKSINFPRQALIGSIVLKTLFSHISEIAVFALFMIYFDIPLTGLMNYLAIAVFFCIFTYGVCLTLSAVTIYFTDMENVWQFVFYLIWFGTPIFYAIGGQTRLFFINLFNPMYYFITIARDTVIYSVFPELWMIVGAMVHAALALGVGIFTFKRLEHRFAELI